MDPRAFFRECVPLSAAGLHMSLLAPHGINGLRHRVSLSALPARKNRFLRMLFTPVLLPVLLRQQASLYHLHDPELLPLALLLKYLFGRKVVYDSREDFPAMMANKRYLPVRLRPLFARAVSLIEWLSAHLLDGILTADTSTLRRFARAGHSRKMVFFNFPNLDVFPDPRPTPKPYDLVYRGGISERAGSYLLLDALCLLRDHGRPIKALLLGYFDDPRTELEFRSQVSSRHLIDSIDLRSRMDHSRMAATLAQARVGVCPLQPVPKFMSNLPVKVFEYWACGLPVVASELPPIRPFFRHGEYGLLFKPGDSASLAASAEWLLDHPSEARRMGAAGRAAVVQRFNNRYEVRKLLDFYAHILQ